MLKGIFSAAYSAVNLGHRRAGHVRFLGYLFGGSPPAAAGADRGCMFGSSPGVSVGRIFGSSYSCIRRQLGETVFLCLFGVHALYRFGLQSCGRFSAAYSAVHSIRSEPRHLGVFLSCLFGSSRRFSSWAATAVFLNPREHVLDHANNIQAGAAASAWQNAVMQSSQRLASSGQTPEASSPAKAQLQRRGSSTKPLAGSFTTCSSRRVRQPLAASVTSMLPIAR